MAASLRMASKINMIAILAILVVAISTLSHATEYLVGDEYGWTLGFNYTAWSLGKEFRVGDTLVFKYPVGYHNVFKVGGPDFQACKVPPANEALTTGNDVITLKTAGSKWYICGIGNGLHCEAGQKLVITVLPAGWQAPSPSPSTYASISDAPPPSDAAAPGESIWFFNRFLK